MPIVDLKESNSTWKAIFVEGESRKLDNSKLKIFVGVGFIVSLYQVWSVIYGKLDPINQMSIHLSLMLALTFFLFTFSKKIKSNKAIEKIDFICIVLAIISGIYYSLNAERIATRAPGVDLLTNWDVFFGLVFVVLAIEAARRTIGFAIIVVALVFIAYALFGHHATGIWYHREISGTEVLDQLAFGFNGLWGSPIAVAASFVFIFVLFGSFLQKSGAGQFFFELSISIAGRSRGGAAKIAVIASAFFGTISGSPTANVVTTGAFTIPMAKKIGYSPRFAAAVESVASTGGSILPPIMGSSAFLMAAVTGISYKAIVVAAILPAVLYYVSLFAMVHFEALRLNLPKADEEDIPNLFQTLKSGWFHFLPVVVLVGFLLQGASPSRTGVFGILAIIFVSWFRKNTKMGIKSITEAMADGAKSAVPVTTACAAAGLVIAGIMATGLGGKLNSIVLSATAGELLPSLFLVMVMCIILGMGMPVAAAYVLTAMLAAPTLISMGVSVMSAHLFIVYFSIISAITPPVAVAAFAAAGIAGANPTKVGFEAVRLGLAAFIVPFLFIFNPALLMEGPIMNVIYSFIISSIGVITVGAGVIGFFYKKANWFTRVLLIGTGIAMVVPEVITDVIGLVMILLIFYIQRKQKEIVVDDSRVTA